MQYTFSTRMEKLNPKETINLLDLLSESDSDSTDLILTPKKKKIKRRHRPRTLIRTRHNNLCGCNKSDMRVISLWLAAVLITFWLIALSWLAAILYGEIKKMDISIKSGKCHFNLCKQNNIDV
ncbi:uncharacterized protein LOC116853653 [Odontomachus brunneus]|uniref:uncharacterized protein LOC116853653 n=1 Tax=Odontomachus brunneus TaxID=486640 RepID=UPI0013F21786|nr:uncharacterized protein LOC116853653 [Odontomachus brunneus]